MRLIVERSRRVLDEHGPLAMGFYNIGPAVPRGLLHPRDPGAGRHRYATPRRQHPPVHGDVGLRSQGDVRHATAHPGSFDDFDLCDTIFTVGHNIAETHTVLWMRVLDRLDGPEPRRGSWSSTPAAPRSPNTRRSTCRSGRARIWRCSTASSASSIRAGRSTPTSSTRTPSGSTGWRQVVSGYDAATRGRDLRRPADDIRARRRVIGESRPLVSTCLQGVYQSHQATASACQVNNISCCAA